MNKLFDKLANQEREFFGTPFLAPTVNCPITVKINGVVLTLKVDPPFTGWGVFESNGRVAKLVREATKKEKRGYLDLFPRLSFMICEIEPVKAIALLDNRFSFSGMVDVLLAESVELFDVVFGRFNGTQVWFDSINRRYPRNIVREMRQSLNSEINPNALQIAGVSNKEKLAYEVAYREKVYSSGTGRLERAVSRGGGKLESYREQGNSYRVTYTVDNQQHTSIVDKATLRVSSAGICLNDHRTGIDHDSDYDLQSLIGVIREGQNRGQIYRVGANR